VTEEHPELSPAETERVRRLLAEARHTGPVPDDVAARLDRTLASLSDERRERAVVPLASRASRRRRNLAGLLAAAVAVVAGGVGLGQVLSGSETGRETGSDSAGSSSTASDGSGESADGPTEADSAPAQEPDEGAVTRAAPPLLDDDTFDADALAARDARTAAADDRGGSFADSVCARATWGEGRRVLVRYGGDRGVLVFRDPVGGLQGVDLFRCDADVPLRSTTVPAP
jgi:hypothetical protein